MTSTITAGSSKITPSAKKPRIVVLAKYYFPYNGGIENATRVFCEGLARTYDVKVIAFNHQPGFVSETVHGIAIERHSVQGTLKSQPLSISYFWAALRSRANITHYHAPNVVASLALALRPPRRLIVVHHMDIYGRPQLRRVARHLYDAVLRRSKLLVVTSLKNARVSADIRVDVPTRAVPLGIDPNSYKVDEALRAEASAWRRELAGNNPLIGFVGRHVRYKGLDVLLKAMVHLPDAHLAVAGDGPQNALLRGQAAALGLTDRVHFLGEVSHRDKLKLLTAITAFAFPSTEITEAFGISQLEAMLLGAPVVASDLPTGVSDVSRNDETALTVPPDDPSALAVALRLLLENHSLRERLADKAKAEVLKHFTVTEMTRRFNNLNDEVLNDSL